MAKPDSPPELLDSGKVQFTIDGKTYEWRRPKVKEYRALLEKSLEMAKKMPTDTSEPSPELVELTTTLSSEWFMGAHQMLGSPAMENTDAGELPAWVLSPDFMGNVVTHFTKVPTMASGNQ